MRLSGAVRAFVGTAAALMVALAVLAFATGGLGGVLGAPMSLGGMLLVLAVGPLLVVFYLKRDLRFRLFRRLAEWLYTWLVPVLMAPLLYLAARVMLWLNGLFLRAGRLDELTAGTWARKRAAGSALPGG